MINNQRTPNADDLYNLSHDLAKLLATSTTPATDTLKERWIADLRRADAGVLIELIGCLTSEKNKAAANIKAVREAIISELELKNTNRIVATMKKLDAAANRLTWASFFVGIVGMILAAIQVWQGFSKP